MFIANREMYFVNCITYQADHREDDQKNQKEGFGDAANFLRGLGPLEFATDSDEEGHSEGGQGQGELQVGDAHRLAHQGAAQQVNPHRGEQKAAWH